MDINEHIKAFLSYYADLERPPGYAVMINGKWGAGKTYLIKKYLDAILRPREKQFAYISLYGLASTKEIDRAFYSALYPFLDSKAGMAAATAARAAAKWLKVDTEFDPRTYLNRDIAEVLVFDDIERCEIDINIALGYINKLVEHQGCKAILIANEEEITQNEKYKRIREKLIGRTLEVRPVLHDAVDAFLNDIDNRDTRKVVDRHIKLIKDIYHFSRLGNLRVLKQSIEDFARIANSLDQKYLEDAAAIEALASLFFPLAIEFKSGRLSQADLCNRDYSLVRRHNRDGEDTPPISVSQSRYPEVDLSSSLISDTTLVNILTKGLVDKQELEIELAQSSFFRPVREEQPWVTVWHAIERDEEQFTAALKTMEQQFLDRTFTNTGEIMQVIGIRLWLNEIGVHAKDKASIASECRAYIDDLYTTKRLEPTTPDEDSTVYRLGGYGGLANHARDMPEYRDLVGYLFDKRQAAEEREYPAIVDSLMELMRKDPRLFARRIMYSNSEENLYPRTPIFKQSQASSFVSQLLELDYASQRTVLSALKRRYEHGRLNDELASERQWIEQVRDGVIASTKGSSAISRYRVDVFLKHTINTVLEEPRAAANQD